MIKWEEIAEVFPSKIMGQRFLSIVPKNTEAISLRQGQIKRILMKINEGISHAPIKIPQSILPISIEGLLSQIGKYYDVKIGGKV